MPPEILGHPTSGHPDSELLHRFMRGEADAGERRTIVRHLLAGCPDCTAVTRGLWRLGEPPAGGGAEEPAELAAYGRLLEELLAFGPERERRARGERNAAPERLAELRALPRGEPRLAAVEGAPFRTPAVCDLLVAESRKEGWKAGPGAAAAALEWAGLAVAVAGRLDAAEHGESAVRGAAARAWVALGEARRQAGDLPGAGEALAAAGWALRDGGADPLDRAELLELRARLAAAAGRLEEALPALQRARALHERLGNAADLVRLRRLEGTFAADLGAPEVAEAAYREAMRQALAAGVAAEAARALLDLALLYTREGRSAELAGLAGELRPICRVAGAGVVLALLFFRQLVEGGHATAEALAPVAGFLAGEPPVTRG